MTFTELSKKIATCYNSLPALVDALRDGFASVEGGGSSEHNYSTEEQKIGKWIDGKDLYEITVSTTTPSTADTSATIHAFASVINPVQMVGLIDSQYDPNTYWDSDTHVRTWISVIGDVSNVRCNAKGSLVINKPIKITVRYTK